MMQGGRPLLLLDRDGTLIEEVDYLSRPEQVELIAGGPEVIRRAHELGWAVVLVTNQSGVGRGYFSLEDVAVVHTRLQELLREQGAELDRMEICPHLPEVGCACRKPAPAMAARAAEALGGDLSSSVVVGDKAADMELARGIGAAAVLVRTGYGEGTEVSMGDRSAHLVLNNIGELLPWLERGAEGIRAAAEGREAIP